MDLNLKEIFEKDIDRPIDSVIKADDEESILNELEEYVITNEIEKNFNKFFRNIITIQIKMGYGYRVFWFREITPFKNTFFIIIK